MTLDKSDEGNYTDARFAQDCALASSLTTEVAVARTLVTDLAPVLRFGSLESLTATRCGIARIVALPGSLRHLMLNNCQLADLAFLAAVPRVQTLYLENNRVAALAQLVYFRHCPALERLWLSGNPVCADPGYAAALKGALDGRSLRNLDRCVLSEEQRKEFIPSGAPPAPAAEPAGGPEKGPAEPEQPGLEAQVRALQAQAGRIETALGAQRAATEALGAKLDRVLALLEARPGGGPFPPPHVLHAKQHAWGQGPHGHPGAYSPHHSPQMPQNPQNPWNAPNTHQ